MTLQEFKAWFDGFTENIDKLPSQKQWKRIQERVAEIDGTAVTERVYVDRADTAEPTYWPLGTFVSNNWATTPPTISTATIKWSGVQAMGDAGRAEAQSLI